MKLLYVDSFGICIGYLCAENVTEAGTMAANILGFDGLPEYVADYPGSFNNSSEIRELIKDDTLYQYFTRFPEYKDALYILNVGDISVNKYIDEVYEEATCNDEECIDAMFPGAVLIVPKIEEIKKCDKFFDQFKLEDMWFCEDWEERE